MTNRTTEITEGHSGLDRIYAGAATAIFAAIHAGARLVGVGETALRQRRGEMPPCAAPCLWLHGASAGEMAAAANLVAILRDAGVRFAAAYTTTNDAGLRFIQSRLDSADVAALAPWDMPRWVGRACDAWRPLALVLIETELWPGLIGAAAARGIPVLCASARIYPRDVPRYRVIRRWLRPTLRRIDAVLAQSDQERARFVALGAPPARCTTAGNLKHAVAVAADGARFRAAVGLDRDEPLIVIGSLHADEIEFAAAVVARVQARVVIAPRHERATALIAGRGWRLTRRSHGPIGAARVLLLDTMGELNAAYAAATVAVVGGSFAPHGGHDLVEPVRAGAPVLFGRHTGHIAEADALRAADVGTPDALAACVAAWLADPALRHGVQSRQRAVLPDTAAIAARYLAALAPLLPQPLGTSVAK